MSSRVLNWGLLSTARINRAIVPPLKSSRRNRLLAVASRTQAFADEYARKREIPRAYASYDELLADPDIDVIYNPLPNHMHAAWTIKAMRMGKHVLCEKPMALTLAEMEAIASTAQETGRVVAEAFMYRHHPQTLLVKQMLDRGQLGELLFIRGSFTYTLTREGNFRADPGMGGGSLWDVGCYPISYARMLAGHEPEEVFGWQVPSGADLDMAFFGQMRFRGGVHAQFDSSFLSQYRVQMEVVGREGALYVSSPYKPGHGEKLILTRADQVETIKVPGMDLYVGEVEDMADAILDGKPPRISLADSRGNLAAILALLESARTGMPQKPKVAGSQ